MVKVSAVQAASLIGRNERRIRNWIATQRLPATKVGHTWQIETEDLERISGIKIDDAQWSYSRRFRHISSSAFNDRHHSSSIRCASCLRESCHRLPHTVCSDLHHRYGADWFSPQPWHMEHVSVIGPEPSAVYAYDQAIRCSFFLDSGCRICLRTVSRADRTGEVTWN